MFPEPDFSRQGSQQTYASGASEGSFMKRMSAVERSQYLRAVRMTPYLQLMVGCVVVLFYFESHNLMDLGHYCAMIRSMSAESGMGRV